MEGAGGETDDFGESGPLGLPGTEAALVGLRLRCKDCADETREAICWGGGADSTAELEDESVLVEREESIAVAKESVEPAGNDEAERGGERLLKESARRDGSGAVLVSDRGEGIAKRVEVGEDHRGCGTK